MGDTLATTNILLTVMAVVSALEGLLLIGACIGGLMVYRKVTSLMDVVESRHLAPAMARVNAILDDVKGVSATVKGETDRVDHAIHRTVDRVDDTVVRMRNNVRVKTSRMVGLVRGVRVALQTMLQDLEVRS